MLRGEIVYKTVKMECFPNANYIANSTCKVKAISWIKSVSNMDCDVVKPLTNVSVKYLPMFCMLLPTKYFCKFRYIFSYFFKMTLTSLGHF